MPYDPRDPLKLAYVNSDTNLFPALDLPELKRTGDAYTDSQYVQNRAMLQGAHARGVISGEEAINAYEQNDTGIFARTLQAATGIEATEDGLQTFVDVLSLGNYSVAALSKARHEAIKAAGEGTESGSAAWWDPVRWLPVFSTEEYRKAFRERTMFADVFGTEYGMTAGGVGAFVLDVALDPVTYLTLGTGAGAKVSLKSTHAALPRMFGDEIAKKAGKEGAEVTLSRWGTKVHKEAVRELMPQIEKEIAEEVAEGSTLAATRQRQLLSERATNYMIDNYDRLSKKAWENERKFFQGGMRTKARGVIGDVLQPSQRGLVGLGGDNVPLARQMFVESSPMHLKELGVPGAALRRKLQDIPKDRWYGDYFTKAMTWWNKEWNLDDNTRLLHGVMTDTINSQRRQWTRAIANEFKDLSDAEASTVSTIIEAGFDRGARNANDMLDNDYAPHLLEAASKARKIFDDIAEEEQKYGILNNTYLDYVTHMFKGDTAKIDMFQKQALDKNWSTKGNKYSQHRFVASISDLKGIMPDDVVEDNIYKILMRRKIMSIEMVNRQKFYLEMQATHGFPAALTAMAGESIPAAIRQRMLETRGTPFDISEVNQWFAHGDIDTAKWGFREGKDEHNLKILEWLTTNREARDTTADWMTDHLRNYTGTIKTKFGRRISGESLEVDAMKAIRGVMTGDPFDQMPFSKVNQAIGKLDDQLRSAGIGPLLGLMPELEGKLKAGLRNPAKPGAKYKDLMKQLKRPVKGLQKSAQIPEDLVTRAIQYRQAMGILTDTVKPSEHVVNSIKSMLGRDVKNRRRGFGFKPEETRQLLDVMFDKKNLDELTAKEADRLENFLSLHHGDPLARDRYKKFTGQRMIKVDFATPRGAIPSAVKTNLFKVLDKIQGSKKQAAKNVEELNDSLGVVHGKIDKLTAKRNKLEQAGKKKTKQYKDVVEEISQLEKKAEPIRKRLANRRAEVGLAGAREKLAKAHSKQLQFPSKANEKALKKAEENLKTAAEKAGLVPDKIIKKVEKEIIEEVADPNVIKTATDAKAAADEALSSAQKMLDDAGKDTPRIKKAQAAVDAAKKAMAAAGSPGATARESVTSGLEGIVNSLKKSGAVKEEIRDNNPFVALSYLEIFEDILKKWSSGQIKNADEVARQIKRQWKDRDVGAGPVLGPNNQDEFITWMRSWLDDVDAVDQMESLGIFDGKIKVKAGKEAAPTVDDAALRAAKAELEAARAVGAKDIDKLKAAVAEAKVNADEAAKGLKKAETTAPKVSQKRTVVEEVEEVVEGTGPDLTSGVEVLPKAARVFTPGDARTADDIVRAGTEEISPGFDVSRQAGTFGPTIQEVGERALSIEASSYYMPESIAKIIKEVSDPLYGHSDEVNWLMRKYDAVQNMFKAPLMAVWPEFYMRNSVTNVALTYLQSGLAMLHPTYQQNYLKVMTYVLHKEVVDIDNLAKSQAAFMGVMGAGSGALIGAQHEHQATDSGIVGSVLSGRALIGALGGTAAGAVAGGVAGGALRAGLQNVAEGGVAAQSVAGGVVGALAAGPEDGIEGRLVGAALGAGAAGGATRYALGDGYRNLEKLAKHKIKLSNGVEFTVEEMAQEAARRGVFTTHVSEELFKDSGVKVLAMAERAGVKADAGWEEALKPANAVFARDVFRAGELASEIPSRLMLFTIEAQRTGSLGQAARAVKDYLFDYANLSLVERRTIKRFIPFYTWSKHALMTSVDSLVNNPGRVAQQYKFVANQNKHQDADPADYPDWLLGRLKRIKTTRSPQTGEKQVEVKTGYGFVHEDTMMLWKELFGGHGEKLLARGPFGVTTALENMVDKDFFRGTHIKSKLYERSSFESGRAFQDAPPWMKQAVGYRIDPTTGRARVDPRAAWLLGEVPTARFFNVAKKVYDSDKQEYNWFALARQVLGEKVYKYGPEQRLYHDKAKLDRMAMFLKRIGEINTMQKTFPTQRSSGPDVQRASTFSKY